MASCTRLFLVPGATLCFLPFLFLKPGAPASSSSSSSLPPISMPPLAGLAALPRAADTKNRPPRMPSAKAGFEPMTSAGGASMDLLAPSACTAAHRAASSAGSAAGPTGPPQPRMSAASWAVMAGPGGCPAAALAAPGHDSSCGTQPERMSRRPALPSLILRDTRCSARAMLGAIQLMSSPTVLALCWGTALPLLPPPRALRLWPLMDAGLGPSSPLSAPCADA
mmetsp:Transcript_1118/g.3147  ORF Transcript_1118/g.3147 Transcript_1118/m.3147 type:complete len:224 (-) Transcript_1118:487-1158(-)